MKRKFRSFLAGGVAWQLFLGVVTLAAIALELDVEERTLAYRYRFPQMSLHEPARVLFRAAERARHSTVAPNRALRTFPEWKTCELCSEAKADEAFDWLLKERQYYRDSGHRRLGNATWVTATQGVRLVVLAGWGSPKRLDELRAFGIDRLPEYAQERARELLSGDAAPERARIEQAGRLDFAWWARRLLMLASIVLLVAYWRGFRYPRRPARCQLAAPDPWRAVVIFTWARGLRAALTLLRWEDPEGLLGSFASVPSLLPAITVAVLLVTTRRKREDQPLKRLLACPADRRSRIALAAAAVAATGLGFWFWQLGWPVMDAIHLAPGWYENAREQELFGSTSEAVAHLVSSIVFAPLGEELLFRGVLFGALAQRFNVHRAALVSSLIFAAVHGYGVFGSALMILQSYLWCRIDARTGTLAPSTISHAMTNFVIGIARFLSR